MNLKNTMCCVALHEHCTEQSKTGQILSFPFLFHTGLDPNSSEYFELDATEHQL